MIILLCFIFKNRVLIKNKIRNSQVCGKSGIVSSIKKFKVRVTKIMLLLYVKYMFYHKNLYVPALKKHMWTFIY